MPLAFDDPLWEELETAYGEDLVGLIAWLREAYEGRVSHELLGNIVNEVCHQGDSSPAMYAVASHFLTLAKRADEPMAKELVIHAGFIHGMSQFFGAVPCPAFLEAEFTADKESGKRELLPYLAQAQDFDDFKNQLEALAGFSGFGRFGKLINGFDFFEDRFSHQLFGEQIEE